MRALAFLPTVFALLLPLAAADPPKYFLQVTGQKQGQFYATNTTKLGFPANSIPALSFNFSASSPLSAASSASGAGAGRPVYQPLKISKDLDVGSPLFLEAFSNSELLTEVALTMSEGVVNGEPASSVVYKLTNSFITSIQQSGGITKLVEDITLEYQKLEILYSSEIGSTGTAISVTA